MGNYALNHRKFLEENEWRWLEANLIQRLASADQIDRRNAVLILIGLRTGARSAEILRLSVRDFQAKKGTLFFHGVKGSRDREIKLPPYLSEALANYLRDNPMPTMRRDSRIYARADFKNRMDEVRSDERIFPISYMTLHKTWAEHSPNPERTFHSLRHTFGLNAYKKTKDIRLVQYALGHKSITNTLIYVDYAYSQAEMKKLIF